MSQIDNQMEPIFDARRLLRVCAVVVLAGGLLGTIGPFGTFQTLETLPRYGFWIGAVFVGMMIHIPLFYAAAWIGRERKLPVWLWVGLSAVVAAVPMTFVINGIFASIAASNAFKSLPALYPFVLAISLPMQFVAYATSKISNTLGVSAAIVSQPSPMPMPIAKVVEAPTKPAAIFARLPGRIGRAIVCLEMEDHYVRIHTQAGDSLVHMRMSDAQNELDGVEGMLVHRSYWVARSAVTGWERDGKSLRLHLNNGKSVPVARDRQPLVKAAGWLE